MLVCRGGGAAHFLPGGVATALQAGAVGDGAFTEFRDREAIATLLEGMLVKKM